MKGFLPISRSLFDHPFWREERSFSKAEAWIDLVQSVRFEASSAIVGGKLIELQKGEMVAARRFLEKRWGWGSTKVTTFLRLLESMEMVAIKSNQGQTILTLCNYESYNNQQTRNKPETNHSQTTAKPKEKKVNKENKEKEEALPHADLFSEAWKDWKKFRIEKRAKLTPSTIKAQLNKLGAMKEIEAVQTIRLSIEKGWQGLFPEKISVTTEPATNNEADIGGRTMSIVKASELKKTQTQTQPKLDGIPF